LLERVVVKLLRRCLRVSFECHHQQICRICANSKCFEGVRNVGVRRKTIQDFGVQTSRLHLALFLMLQSQGTRQLNLKHVDNLIVSLWLAENLVMTNHSCIEETSVWHADLAGLHDCFDDSLP